MARLPPVDRQRSNLVVVGESCRALARSCRLAGWDVSAIDRYGDRDLIAVCQHFHPWPATETLRDAPLGPLWHALAGLPTGPILPAGGMEQSHRAPRQIPPGFVYCGPQIDQLEPLRDVRQWRRWAKQAALHFPTTLLCCRDTARTKGDWPAGWLIKRSDSGGGLGVRSAVELDLGSSRGDIPLSHTPSGQTRPESPTISHTTARHYLQRRLPGPTIGVVIASSPSGSRVLGASAAVEAHQWPGPGRFIYRGSYGPIHLPSRLMERLRQLAERVTERTGLRGVWGVDLARSWRGEWCLLEINPRWSASMEILELAGGGSLAAVHLDAWGWPSVPPSQAASQSSTRLLKLVIYCRQTFRVTEHQSDALFAHRLPDPTSAEAINLIGQSAAGWRLADIPKAGDVIPAGAPLMTLLVWGPQQQLWKQAQRVRQHRLPPLFLDGHSKV